jgi:protein TonB
MAKPLRSEDPGQIKSVQFAHFGLLDAGAQSKTSTVTAIVLNVLIAFVIIVVGAATKKVHDNAVKLTELTAPVLIKKPEPPPPAIKIKIPPPPKLVEVPKVVVQPPKIKLDVPKPIDIPKPAVVKMDTPKPVIAPPAPVKIVAPPAPVAVSLAHPAPASTVNHDAHPTAVQLGNATSPINNLKGPSVAKVNLASGMANMPPGNTGHGPAATSVSLGNGSPSGTAMKGATGPVAVNGLPHGVPNGTGNGVRGPEKVQMATAVAPPTMPRPAVEHAPARSGPKVTYKPKPVYSAEAIQLHLEGNVSVSIRVTATGAVEVLQVTRGLGHGLDEAAVNAIKATRFQPATDASGNPVPWEGIVTVAFQLAG